MGIDDREDKLARFCLITGTFTIEQYCKRRLLRKKQFEHIPFYSGLILPLREYPVSKVLAVYLFGNGEMLEPEFYRVILDCGTDDDLPFSLELSPAVARMGCRVVKVVYWAGYSNNKEQVTGNKERRMRVSDVPAGLQAACLKEIGFEQKKMNDGRYWQGLRIKAEPD